MTDRYKIMIVDDEEEVREGIARKVNWQALGFEIVATAENGEDALEKAENLELDVVLTDIKMPFMDGLTLGARLRVSRPNIKLVVLTGFDEFEFAKKAVGIGVVEYVLKPVNGGELSEILTRVKTTLDQDIASKRSIQLMRENYERSLPLLREHFLNELLWGMVPRADMDALVTEYGLPFVHGQSKNVTVYDIDPKSAEASGIEPELVPISVKRVIDAHCEGRCICETCIGARRVIAITEWTTRSPISEVMLLASEVIDECRRVLELRVTAGVGSCCDSISRLSESYADAVTAAEYKAVAGIGSVLYIRDMELASRAATLDTSREKQLTSAVKFGSDAQIRETVDEILTPISGLDTNSVSCQAYLISVFGLVLHILPQTGLQERDVLDERAKAFFRLAGGIDLGELRDWLVGVCEKLAHSMSEQRVSTEERLVAEAKSFLESSYQDTDLSVERLCDHLHISQSYFSALFKKVTGQTYINYLTELRLRKAVELLTGTEEKTYTIANSVGYEEPNYFSYVFKKRFGLTPSQYRAGRQSRS